MSLPDTPIKDDHVTTTYSPAPPRAAQAKFAAARNTYTADAVQTVTPNQLLVMVFDGLVRHLDIAVAAIQQGDIAAVNERLTKSQALLFELEVSLDLTVWPEGASLKQLYGYLSDELVEANLTKDAARVTACRAIIAPLAETWREAARLQAATPAPVAGSLSLRA
jgi:flagellar secretion chaperone FliS